MKIISIVCSVASLTMSMASGPYLPLHDEGDHRLTHVERTVSSYGVPFPLLRHSLHRFSPIRLLTQREGEQRLGQLSPFFAASENHLSPFFMQDKESSSEESSSSGIEPDKSNLSSTESLDQFSELSETLTLVENSYGSSRDQ